MAFACVLAFLQQQVQAGGVGTWKAYLAYHDITWAEKGGNRIYILASNDLYSYNENDNSIQTFDKINGLSDNNIGFIGWNKVAKRLVIAYSNYNIDLMDEKREYYEYSRLLQQVDDREQSHQRPLYER